MGAVKVNLGISADEALVLFEWIKRFNEADDEGSFQDQAEQRVLWDLEGLLEKQLVEPFAGNYDELLAAARAKVRDPE